MGVAQGCPLSVYLFSIFVDSLLQKINEEKLGASFSNSERIDCLAFADDIIATAENKNDLQKILEIVHTWCKDWRMTASANKKQSSKSAVMPVNAGPLFGQTLLKLGTRELPMVDNYKYLGVTFDGELTFDLHRANVNHKSNFKNKLISSIVSDMFLSRDLKVQVHEALVNSAVLYGMETW